MKNQEPAFPTSFGMQGAGMTLRDYFAAKTLAAMITLDADHHTAGDQVRWAYEYADMMMNQRNEISGD